MICELCGLVVGERGALVHMEWHDTLERRLDWLQERLDGLSTNL